MSKLEALADSIISLTGYLNPESQAYQIRNPGMLPAISPKHPRDEKNRRIFKSYLDGYQALLFDLVVKCGGKSRTFLRSDSSLRDLFKARGEPETSALYAARFLRRALHDDSISDKTSLSYFLED
jgi:hypothetical protein